MSHLKNIYRNNIIQRVIVVNNKNCQLHVTIFTDGNQAWEATNGS